MHVVAVSGSHMKRLRHAVVVPCLLSGEAFVRRVAGVSKPRPLLKLVHAVMCLFCDMRGQIISFKSVNVKRQLMSYSTTLHTTKAKKSIGGPLVAEMWHALLM